MNGLDLILVLLAAGAAVGGWKLGFMRRLAGWIGAAIGFAVAIPLTPLVTRHLEGASDLVILTAGAALLVLPVSLGQGIGVMVGSRARRAVGSQTGSYVDSVGGALLGVFGVATLAWLVLPVMAETPGWPATSALGSGVSQAVNQYLPDPPSQITEIERQLAGGEFPKVFAGFTRAPALDEPPEDSPIAAAQVEQIARSVVRVQAPACDRIQSGSGFFVASRLVATNAHVVAGSNRVTVDDGKGGSHRGTVIHFDPEIDLAIISTDLDRPPLEISEASVGDKGLVMGFPGGGPLDPSPFSVGRETDARGYDIYDSKLVTRDLLILASSLQPGDSGSAVVKTDGSVIGVAVAIAPDRSSVAYALSSEALREIIADTDPSPADTGDCV